MKLQRCGLGLILALWVPWTLQASELSPKQLKKSLKQAKKSWNAGQVQRAAELYQDVLAATSAGDKERPDALYVLSLLALAPGSDDYNRERATRMLKELAASFPTHLQRETQALLGSLEGDIDARARAEKEMEETRRQREQELTAMLEERQAAEARVTSLTAELEEVQKLLARKDQKQANKCQEIEQELKKAKEDIRKLAQECAGCSDGP